MTPLEKAARALCAQRGRNPDRLEPGYCPYSDDREVVDGTCANGDPGFFVWRLHEDDARAVLEAIREPSEAMIQRGASNDPRRDRVVVQVWQAMITAALSEPLPVSSGGGPTEEIRS